MRESSQFRVEKHRASAQITLASGESVSGCFFLSGSTATHSGPERIADLLNGQPGFFPFELDGGTTALFNRGHIVAVELPSGAAEARLDPGYAVATKRRVGILLSTGERLEGLVAVYRPFGHDRLSDYARTQETFRYVETDGRTLIVNSNHMVELMEIPGQ